MTRTYWTGLLLIIIVVFTFSVAPATTNSVKNSDDLRMYEDNEGILIKKIIAHLQSGNYKVVELYIDGLVIREPLNNDGTRILDVIYSRIPYRRHLNPAIKTWSSRNTHHAAETMTGLVLINEAWLALGSGYSYTISNRGSIAYKEKLREAMQHLEKAYNLNPKDPNAPAAMIKVCMGLSMSRDEMEKWFKNAVTADASAIVAYNNKLQFLAPKWHGSLIKYSEFAYSCFRDFPKGSRVYTVMTDYIYELGQMSENQEEFYQNQEIRAMLNGVFMRWETDFPDSDLLLRVKGLFQEQAGNFDKALSLYNQALERDPENLYNIRFRADLYFFELDNGKAAIPDYIKIIKDDPMNDKVIYKLGQVFLYDMRDYEKAVEYLSGAISLNKTHPDYYFQRGIAKERLKEFKDAIGDFNHAIRIDRKMSRAYRHRGDAHYFLNDYETAVDDYTASIEINPKVASAHYYRGLCFMKTGQYLKASEDFLEAKRLNTKYTASVDRHIKEMEEIEAAGSKTKEEKHPSTTIGLADKGTSQESKSKTVDDKESINIEKQQSVALAPKGLKKPKPRTDYTPTDLELLRGEAMQCFRKHDMKCAEARFLEVLRIDPNNEHALLKLATICLKSKINYKLTVHFSNRLLELNPSNVEALHLRADAFRTQKLKEVAIKDYRRILEIDPDYQKIYTVLLHLASLTISIERDYPTAIEYYNKMIERKPVDKQARNLQAKAYLNSKEYKKTIDGFTSLIKENEKDGAAYYWRGLCHQRMKNYAEAKEDYLRAREYAPAYKQGAESGLKRLEELTK